MTTLCFEFTKKVTTREIKPGVSPDPGATRIEALESVRVDGPAYIDGALINSFAAALILAAYDCLPDKEQRRFRNVPAGRMLLIAGERRAATGATQRLAA